MKKTELTNQEKYIKQIDDVLRCFLVEVNEYLTSSQVNDLLLAKKVKIEPVRVEAIIKQLEKDGFVENINKPAKIKQGDKLISTEEHDQYFITYDGLFLLEDDGYASVLRDATTNRRRERKLSQLTFWIAFGTVGLLIAELFRIRLDHPEIWQWIRSLFR